MATSTAGISEYKKLWTQNLKKDPLVAVKIKKDDGADKISSTATSSYYSAATWIYELAWGKSFHFGRMYHKMSFSNCLLMHELFLYAKLGVPNKKEMWLDVGCGVGGPMTQAVRFGNGKLRIFGVNNNQHQIKRLNEISKSLGLASKINAVNCTFADMKFDDESFDKAYSIEATCHASNLYIPYSNVFRVLKPGGLFACYEWVVTDKYDKNNDKMREYLVMIQEGCSLTKLHTVSECKNALTKAGFEILEMEDLADDHVYNPEIERRWYVPLTYEYGIPIYDTIMRILMRKLNILAIFLLTIAEKLGLIKPGYSAILEYLNRGGIGLSESGRLGTYTPMFFFLARKPC